MRQSIGFYGLARELERSLERGNFGEFKKHSPLDWYHRGLVLKTTRTVALAPEIKEGLFHHHNPTSQLVTFSFLLSSWLFS